MSPRTIAVALVFGLSGLASATQARGEGADAAAHPATIAPRFSFLDAPPPPPAPPPPAPAREGDEYARKSWEMFPQLGFAVPFCQGDPVGANHCGGSDRGTGLGGGALYRISPHLGLGAAVSFANFQVDSTPGVSSYSRASFMGLMVRGYFADRGVVDPYVETGVGRGTAAAGTSDGVLDVQSESSGPSVTAGAGVDFWVLPYLKVGPAFSYRWAWLTRVTTCAGGACDTGTVADRGAVGSFASLSFVATLALGREM